MPTMPPYLHAYMPTRWHTRLHCSTPSIPPCLHNYASAYAPAHPCAFHTSMLHTHTCTYTSTRLHVFHTSIPSMPLYLHASCPCDGMHAHTSPCLPLLHVYMSTRPHTRLHVSIPSTPPHVRIHACTPPHAPSSMLTHGHTARTSLCLPYLHAYTPTCGHTMPAYAGVTDLYCNARPCRHATGLTYNGSMRVKTI
jgi:hypothetical protein